MTREPLDLRLAPIALAAWGTAALGLGWSPDRAVVGALVLLSLGGVVAFIEHRRRRSAPRRVRRREVRTGRRHLAAAVFIVAAAALAVSGLRTGAVTAGPIPELAVQQAQVSLKAAVISDPVRKQGTFAPYVLVRVRVSEVTGRGQTTKIRSPVLAIGDPTWMRLELGDRIEASGRLKPAQDGEVSAVLVGDEDPRVARSAGALDRVVGAVREGVKEAVSPLPLAERSLVPALVDGDDSGMPPDVAADFQTTGLTHLLAVSGANLTLVLSFVLVTARWCRVRARGLVIVGLIAVVFFVLLARPQPSVLRAAAMGVVALAGLSSGGRRRGVRALCLAVTSLVLLDPILARAVGFLLSTVATAGILLLAPHWRDCLARWMPRLLAEAIAVPLAAQLACTPAIAAISGQVSLVSVFANLLAAPAVGPTTVIGLLAGLVALVSDPLAHLAGRVAGVPAWWIIWVASKTADFSGASVSWPVGALALTALTGLCAVAMLVMPRMLSSRAGSLACVVVLIVVVVQPLGRLGWPPHGWVMVLCDVGQGDGMVFNAGEGVAVVVDTGPDPALMDRCLDRLDIDRIALIVLTHFHADHVNGLPGALEGRDVSEIETTNLRDPPDRAASVDEWADAAEVPVTVAVTGEQRTIGALSWTVLGPVREPTKVDGGSEEGSGANNASVVMRLETHGHRFLLSGDAEPEEEDDILANSSDLGADVFKVAHHGSGNQDPAFVFATRASLALISVGADNDYGHPAPETLGLLRQLGARTYRTDQDGDIAVVVQVGQLAVMTSD